MDPKRIKNAIREAEEHVTETLVDTIVAQVAVTLNADEGPAMTPVDKYTRARLEQAARRHIRRVLDAEMSK